jgi:PEP-CTERM motif
VIRRLSAAGTKRCRWCWQGLWALTFGSGSASGGSSDILYFTTGLNAETNGLSAALSVVPEPSTLALLGAGVLSLFWWRRRSFRTRDEAAG